MIDKDSAKYHYTLGMAKRAAGDERGAREEFDLAAHLDEEDAEERNEIFVRRQRAEKFRISDTNAPGDSASPPGVTTASGSVCLFSAFLKLICFDVVSSLFDLTKAACSTVSRLWSARHQFSKLYRMYPSGTCISRK